MGIEKDEMSGHGFRAIARTILDEVLLFLSDYIEHQLAHAVRGGPNGRAYNRTVHLVERKNMMQLWADYLDKLMSGVGAIGVVSHCICGSCRKFMCTQTAYPEMGVPFFARHAQQNKYLR